MTAFQTVTDATNIWIKGSSFSIKRLLGDEYSGDASKYEGGHLCIFRLAPQVRARQSQVNTGRAVLIA
jgi:phosphatidylserine decarboxylase